MELPDHLHRLIFEYVEPVVALLVISHLLLTNATHQNVTLGCDGEKCFTAYVHHVLRNGNSNITQNDAYNKCVRLLDGGLASIDSEEEQQLVYEAMYNNGFTRSRTSYWIGAKADLKSSSQWLNGSTCQGTPSSYATIRRRNSSVIFKILPNCSTSSTFSSALCHRKDCTTQCYFAVNASTWHVGRLACLNNDADIATFLQEVELNDLSSLESVLANGVHYAVGLRRAQWVLDSPHDDPVEIGLPDWDTSEPKHILSKQCVALEMNKTSSNTTWKWRTRRCSANITNFICEHYQQNITQSMSSTTSAISTTAHGKNSTKSTRANTNTGTGSSLSDNMQTPASITLRAPVDDSIVSTTTTAPFSLGQIVPYVTGGTVVMVIVVIAIAVAICVTYMRKIRNTPRASQSRSSVRSEHRTPGTDLYSNVDVIAGHQQPMNTGRTRVKQVERASDDNDNDYENLPAQKTKPQRSAKPKKTRPSVVEEPAVDKSTTNGGDGVIYASVVRSMDTPQHDQEDDVELGGRQVIYASLEGLSTTHEQP